MSEFTLEHCFAMLILVGIIMLGIIGITAMILRINGTAMAAIVAGIVALIVQAANTLHKKYKCRVDKYRIDHTNN